MFAEYDIKNFPIVNVKLNNVENDEDFDNFLREWLKLYINKQNFTFVFDTTNVTNVPLKYSVRMTTFIKDLKNNNEIHYLQKSIILVNNSFVKRMLSFIFKIQSPVAPVYITDNKSDIDLLLTNQVIDNVICIMPGNSFIPFL